MSAVQPLALGVQLHWCTLAGRLEASPAQMTLSNTPLAQGALLVLGCRMQWTFSFPDACPQVGQTEGLHAGLSQTAACAGDAVGHASGEGRAAGAGLPHAVDFQLPRCLSSGRPDTIASWRHPGDLGTALDATAAQEGAKQPLCTSGCTATRASLPCAGVLSCIDVSSSCWCPECSTTLPHRKALSSPSAPWATLQFLPSSPSRLCSRNLCLGAASENTLCAGCQCRTARRRGQLCAQVRIVPLDACASGACTAQDEREARSSSHKPATPEEDHLGKAGGEPAPESCGDKSSVPRNACRRWCRSWMRCPRWM